MKIDLNELLDNKPHRYQLDGENICVVKVGDEVFAIGDTCSHSDASLSDGDLNGYKIECWLHGAEFDLRSGEAVTPPAISPVAKYKVKLDEEEVNIEKGDA